MIKGALYELWSAEISIKMLKHFFELINSDIYCYGQQWEFEFLLTLPSWHLLPSCHEHALRVALKRDDPNFSVKQTAVHQLYMKIKWSTSSHSTWGGRWRGSRGAAQGKRPDSATKMSIAYSICSNVVCKDLLVAHAFVFCIGGSYFGGSEQSCRIFNSDLYSCKKKFKHFF